MLQRQYIYSQENYIISHNLSPTNTLFAMSYSFSLRARNWERIIEKNSKICLRVKKKFWTLKIPPTFFPWRKAMPWTIWKAKCIASPIVNEWERFPVDSFHSCEKQLRLFFRNVFKSPCGQYSSIANRLPPLVHAPSKLTMFVCFPMWIRILISDAKSLYSVSVASSTKKRIDD